MRQNQSLRVLESGAENDQTVEVTADDLAVDDDGFEFADGMEVPRRYDDAGEVEISSYESNYTFPRFVDAVLDEVGKDFTNEEARLIDEIDDPDDVDFGFLLALPDESVMFVGSDPTAKDAIPWFTFIVDRHEPMPAPRTAQDALDMLRPPSVQDLVYEDDYLPSRHGEWWLIPTGMMPVGTVFQPGVKDEPYGASPLGNHVPREYAFTVSDQDFMRRFRDEVDAAPASVRTPPDVIEWTWRQIKKPIPTDFAPDWADIREWGGNVLVRGTVRHRDDDHFVEKCDERWHIAVTHDVEVYTGDGVAERVHLDYHGR